jgi:hypothetical protein
MLNYLYCKGIVPLFPFLILALSASKKKDPTVEEIKLRAEPDIKAVLQVQKAFGKYSIETPKIFNRHNKDFEHIKLVNDSELGNAFAFALRRDVDGDRDKIWPKGKERQRNEIKGYQRSPEPMKGKLKEAHHIKWFLKIDKSFQINKEFCHFFQLKAVGSNNIDNPILTLSGVTERGKPQLQLQWWSLKESGRIFLIDWERCKDKWLKCECITKYSKSGSIVFSIRSMDGEINLKKQLMSFETWRDGFEFVRPKWGIYRSLAKEKNKLNPQDQILMNNFSIRKI